MKCLIVDDHPIMRFGVRQLLEQEWPQSDFDEAETLEAALRKSAAVLPDIVILDLTLPDAAGTEGLVRMLRLAPHTPILVLSFNPEGAYAARLLQMGASGYLPKDLARDELVTAVRRILGGKRYVTPSMSDRLLDLLEGKTPGDAPHESLSNQEYRVLLLLANGKSTMEIGEMMHLSAKTVSTYSARILQKTGWKNKVELTKYCVENKLTEKA